MAGAAALGLMITYVFDVLEQPETAFMCFWVTVGAEALASAMRLARLSCSACACARWGWLW